MGIEIDLMDWVANQGFAIAVAGFLLIRIEAKVDKLISVITELCTEIRNHA